jgi:hypothetical protein
MEQVITINDIEYTIIKGIKISTYMSAVYEIEEDGRTYFKACRWVEVMDKNIKEVYYIKEINNTRSSGI